MKRLSFLAVLAVGVMFASGAGSATAYDYQPRPEKASLMAIYAHPDDEGIFFGGAIPYYTQVRQLPTVAINMTTGRWDGQTGEHTDEVQADKVPVHQEVLWNYGLRNEPITPFFQLLYGWSLDLVWKNWSNGPKNLQYVNDIDEGKRLSSRYLAEQIRLYQPDVIIVHDFDGEYGHPDHKATALATEAAWALAAGNDTTIGSTAISADGIPGDPYQAKKLYVHQSRSNGLGTSGKTFENWLFHDYWEDISIDTNGDGSTDKSPRQVTEDAMVSYYWDGNAPLDVSTIYETGDDYEDHPSEWWGLYQSTVGPDTLVDPFTIAGQLHAGWARGDFFENIAVIPEPAIPGDANRDDVVNDQDASILASHWQQSGMDWEDGDFNDDGVVDDRDASILASHWQQTREGEGDAAVPEPTAIVLCIPLCLAGLLLGRRRYRSLAAGDFEQQ